MSLLPRPSNAGSLVTAMCVRGEVGGDYFDFFR